MNEIFREIEAEILDIADADSITYEWVIAKFSIQSLYPEVAQRIYVARNPWWRGL